MSVQTNTQAKVAMKPKEPVFKTPYEKAVGIYISLMGVIALFIPADIFEAHAWASEFTDFMAAWVPQIDLISSLGIRPELNRFYYSVIWAMSPGLFVLCCLMSWEARQRTFPLWNAPLHKAIVLALVAGLVIYAASRGGWITNADNGVIRFILTNRLAMGGLGNIFYVSAPVMAAGGLFVLVAGWLSGEIPRYIRRGAEGGR